MRSAPPELETDVLAALPGLSESGERERFLAALRTAAAHREEEQAIAMDPGEEDQLELPFADSWDPRRAIVQWHRAGDVEEATWLTFLTSYFAAADVGDPWRSVRTVYSGFGEHRIGWRAVYQDAAAALAPCTNRAKEYEGLSFGNHRKNEPLKADHRYGIEAVVRSYLTLVKRLGNGSQAQMFTRYNGDPGLKFHKLLVDVTGVLRFGRLGAFDFLTLLGTLGVQPLAPAHLYLEGSTWPLEGAKRLLGAPDRAKAPELDSRCSAVARELGVSIAVMEEALCTWHKGSPARTA
ncbi:MAG: hypothetical protein ACRDKW_14815 [Actinomycetota bacterium]